MKALLCGAMLAASLFGTAALAEDKVSLRFATIFDGPALELWAPVIAGFTAAHPNIDVKIESTAGSGAAVYPDVLRTSMASGDPADVFFLWGGRFPRPSSRQVRWNRRTPTLPNTAGTNAFRNGQSTG